MMTFLELNEIYYIFTMDYLYEQMHSASRTGINYCMYYHHPELYLSCIICERLTSTFNSTIQIYGSPPEIA